MDIKCSNCSCNLNDAIPQSSYIQLSCSHFLCNNCLSRKILQQNFKPLASKNLVELICDCKGKKLISFKECLDKVSKPLILDNKDKKNSNKCFYHKEYLLRSIMFNNFIKHKIQSLFLIITFNTKR